jgi:hypothetical protein
VSFWHEISTDHHLTKDYISPLLLAVTFPKRNGMDEFRKFRVKSKTDEEKYFFMID